MRLFDPFIESDPVTPEFDPYSFNNRRLSEDKILKVALPDIYDVSSDDVFLPGF